MRVPDPRGRTDAPQRPRWWHGRKGICFALMTVLVPMLLGFAALAVDLGTVALTSAQLRTAADAASLAGARQLGDAGRLAPNFNVSNLLPKVRQRALAVGGANVVLGQPARIFDNPNNTANGDLVVGFKDLTVKNAALDTSLASMAKFNTVRVTARRNADHGGPVPTFFSQLLGARPTTVEAVGTATVQNYAVAGFKCSPSVNTPLVPIALSKTTYDAILAGLTSDKYTAKNGNVTPGADGLFESSLYPVSSGNGNWGTVRIGVDNNGTSTLAGQIQFGVTTSQINTASGGNCNYTTSPSIKMAGNPGVSLGLKPALTSLIGKTVVVPIYDPALSSGNGANFTYTIVRFAPVVVVYASFSGVNSTLLVQPSLISSPTIITGGAQPSWAAGGVVRLRITE